MSKGLPFMVMYITGATRRLRNPGCKGACISCLLLGHLGGRTRLRSRVCSRVVGENINASAQQRI